MTHGVDNVWARRYRHLEQQFEYLLLNVAESMQAWEERVDGSLPSKATVTGPEPRILKIVKATEVGRSYVYCVADGSNMEYRFEVFAKKERVHDSGFSRLNSVDIGPHLVGKTDECRVTLRADFQSRRHELTAHSQLKWEPK